ncbi:MAG TPA: site-2 protease family protein [bacterium]
MEVDLSWRMEEFRNIVGEFFPIEQVWYDGGRPAFAVRTGPDSKERFLRLRERLEPMDYLPLLRGRDDRTVIALIPRPPRGAWRWQVNAALFIATVITTFLAGYYNAQGLVESHLMSSAIGGGLAFSIPLMLILLTHEMGHKVVSIVRGIDASLPYFIPMIPPIGTMGAVIVTRTPAPNRDALLDLGASGPIAGFVVAVVVVIIGLMNSFVISASAVQGQVLVNYPDPLLIRWMTGLLRHPPDGALILMHPVLFAGWIGLLVTSLNLLPAGMLDGGHAVRALFGARFHRVASWLAVAVAVALRYWLMAVLIGVLLVTARGYHPGPLDDVSPPSWSRIAIGAILLVIFILSVVPIEITLLRF